MGKISTCRVRQIYDWYRPLSICFGDKQFAVGEIHLFDKDKGEEIGSINNSYFPDCKCNDLYFSEFETKRAVDLKCQHAFCIALPKKNLSNRTIYALYIPSTLISKTEEKRRNYAGEISLYTHINAELCTGQNVLLRQYENSIYSEAYLKRDKLAKQCNLSIFDIDKVLKAIVENKYSIEELFEKDSKSLA